MVRASVNYASTQWTLRECFPVRYKEQLQVYFTKFFESSFSTDEQTAAETKWEVFPTMRLLVNPEMFVCLFVCLFLPSFLSQLSPVRFVQTSRQASVEFGPYCGRAVRLHEFNGSSIVERP